MGNGTAQWPASSRSFWCGQHCSDVASCFRFIRSFIEIFILETWMADSLGWNKGIWHLRNWCVFATVVLISYPPSDVPEGSGGHAHTRQCFYVFTIPHFSANDVSYSSALVLEREKEREERETIGKSEEKCYEPDRAEPTGPLADWNGRYRFPSSSSVCLQLCLFPLGCCQKDFDLLPWLCALDYLLSSRSLPVRVALIFRSRSHFGFLLGLWHDKSLWYVMGLRTRKDEVVEMGAP